MAEQTVHVKQELRVEDRVRPVEGFSPRAKSMNRTGIVLAVHPGKGGTLVARVKWDGVKDAQSVWIGWLHSITSEEREKQDDRQRHHLGLAGETSGEREKAMTDTERLDALENFVKAEGALLLHDGSGKSPYYGLAFDGPVIMRTLREAIDSAL